MKTSDVNLGVGEYRVCAFVMQIHNCFQSNYYSLEMSTCQEHQKIRKLLQFGGEGLDDEWVADDFQAKRYIPEQRMLFNRMIKIELFRSKTL